MKIQTQEKRVEQLESKIDGLIKTVAELSKRITRLQFKVSDHMTDDRYRQQEAASGENCGLIPLKS